MIQSGLSDPILALGVISGTSMDGIDVALIRTDGVTIHERLGGATIPYPMEVEASLKAFLDDDPSEAERLPLTHLEDMVTQAHGDAIEVLLSNAGIQRPDLIGLHGQTILHRPEQHFTRQLGDGKAVAKRFGIDVVEKFRHADVAAGGQGAPFAPLYHQALVGKSAAPTAVLNLGGVGNLTYLHGDEVLAFDTGPASAMIDDFVRRHFGQTYDIDGLLAQRGTIDCMIVERFLAHPFFNLSPPKSLDRNDFHAVMTEIEALPDALDGVATLTAMTAAATGAAVRHLPTPPTRWLVAGGGRHNRTILAELERSVRTSVVPVEDEGWNGDLVEAECFGFLAVRSVAGLPLSLPTTTGVSEPMTGGVLHRAVRR